MKEKLVELLSKITYSTQSALGDDASLLTGKAGTLLFLHLHDKWFPNAEKQTTFQDELQQVAEQSFSANNFGFCSGKAGINWLFTYLHRNGIIERADRNLVCEDDQILQKVALAMVNNGNYDFLHGALGIAHYHLYTPKRTNRQFFDAFLNALGSLADRSYDKKMIPRYDFERHILIPDQVNLGLAHGITAILKFCLLCYEHDVQTRSAKALALRIMEYLLTHQNKNTSNCFFSGILNTAVNEDHYSRLAWCYGDLGIGYTLFRAGTMLSRADIADLAILILLQSATRRNEKETLITDAGFCHGSTGAVYIFNKIWKETGRKEFKDASDFWLKRTITFSESANWQIANEKTVGKNGQAVHNLSLIEGISGIGLVILNHLFDESSWDYIFMLN